MYLKKNKKKNIFYAYHDVYYLRYFSFLLEDTSFPQRYFSYSLEKLLFAFLTVQRFPGSDIS